MKLKLNVIDRDARLANILESGTFDVRVQCT
jgi:hypothetical protein